MSHQIQCKSCNTRFAVPKATFERYFAGKRAAVKCKCCGELIRVDGTGKTSAPPGGKIIPTPSISPKPEPAAADAAMPALSPTEAPSNTAPKDDTAKEQAPKDDTPNKTAPKDDTAKDQSPKDDTAKDDTAKDDTAKDDTAKEQAPKDDTAKDDTAKDDTAKDDTAKDDTAKDQVPKEHAAKDQAPKEQTPIAPGPPRSRGRAAAPHRAPPSSRGRAASPNDALRNRLMASQVASPSGLGSAGKGPSVIPRPQGPGVFVKTTAASTATKAKPHRPPPGLAGTMMGLQSPAGPPPPTRGGRPVGIKPESLQPGSQAIGAAKKHETPGMATNPTIGAKSATATVSSQSRGQVFGSTVHGLDPTADHAVQEALAKARQGQKAANPSSARTGGSEIPIADADSDFQDLLESAPPLADETEETGSPTSTESTPGADAERDGPTTVSPDTEKSLSRTDGEWEVDTTRAEAPQSGTVALAAASPGAEPSRASDSEGGPESDAVAESDPPIESDPEAESDANAEEKVSTAASREMDDRETPVDPSPAPTAGELERLGPASASGETKRDAATKRSPTTPSNRSLGTPRRQRYGMLAAVALLGGIGAAAVWSQSSAGQATTDRWRSQAANLHPTLKHLAPTPRAEPLNSPPAPPMAKPPAFPETPPRAEATTPVQPPSTSREAPPHSTAIGAAQAKTSAVAAPPTSATSRDGSGTPVSSAPAGGPPKGIEPAGAKVPPEAETGNVARRSAERQDAPKRAETGQDVAPEGAQQAAPLAAENADVDALPEGVNGPGLRYRLKLAIRRAKQCHLRGRATGTARILMTYGSDGKTSDVRLVGEPIASAPVSRCILRELRPLRVRPFNGDSFTIEDSITLK